MLSQEIRQPLRINNSNVPLLHANEAFFLKLGKRPAHGFKLETKIAPDFLTRHAQMKLRG